METNKLLLQINNLSFKYPTADYLLKDLKLTVKEGARIALVGANGSGKSTLLKLLTGNLEIEEGETTVSSKAFYVPQIDLSIPQGDMKIYDYIATFNDEWWNVIAELEKVFSLSLDTDMQTKTLSGGELMKLNLAIALSLKPKVLVLDEPTNHLDIHSVNTLVDFIKTDTKGNYAYVIVSHDTFFLDQVVDTIWELEDKKLTTYGGNYTFYKEQKELHLRGVKKQYDLARESLRRAKELEQKELEKKAKKANEAKRAFLKGSIDKRAYSVGKDAASALQHTKSGVIEDLTTDAEKKLEELETEERHLAFISMKNTSENSGRTIFEIKNGTLTVDKKELINKIDLKVNYGDRVLISGNNGTGKTSLLKCLINQGVKSSTTSKVESAKLKGDIYVGTNLAWVYIDQQYSLINPNVNMLQNLLDYNKAISLAKAKEQLGKFQFKSEIEMNKPARNLSGGEMVRLIMAMVTSFPIDLIILDEPTNNLDVATVEVLEKSLNNFRGAVVLISHNVDFIVNIKIQTAYIIKNKSFKPLGVAPSHKTDFFKALSS